ncbi:MAG: membrane protease YdiL (CAAX protease family) [Bacillariaceae sp.]|jgi:membrane protease YdiL (CAAX protease family)
MQSQIRFSWWTVFILIFQILGGCECLSILNSKSSISSKKRGIYPFALHVSSSQLYYQDDREDVVSDYRQQNNVVESNPSSVQKASNLDDSPSSTVSMPLINSICINQVMLLLLATSVAFIANPWDISSLHWNEMRDFHSLFDWQPSWFRLAEGILATIPMVAVMRGIEASDKRAASHVNFGTTNMVISLFGRRKSAMEPTASASFQVMVLSTMIAISSGISEEVIFRGYIPTALSSMTHSLPLAFLGQALFFAGGHISKNAQSGENQLNGSFQLFNGLWYGVVYLSTGGDIVPCIIAHILYEMHILMETWTSINNQMDYTQESSMKFDVEEENSAIDRLKIQAGVTLNTETVNFARHFFYAFDNDHVGRLSISDCQRAVSYAFMNENAPNPEVVLDLFEQVREKRDSTEGAEDNCHTTAAAKQFEDRLNFSEFLHLLFVLRSNSRGLRS